MYIDGQWCGAEGKGKLAVINPATEEPCAEVACGGAADARRAIDAAERALPGWSGRTAYERADILKATADLMRQRADRIARLMTIEQGKPLAESKGETLATAAFFEWYAEEAKRLYGRIVPHHVPTKRHFVIHHPVGICAAIAPWNFPILLPVRKIAPAIAAGCTNVTRPASQTPLCLMEVFRCLDEAGLPPGVANLVTGPAGEIADVLLADPRVRKIGFTGSNEVGQELMRKAADQVKKISLELGGHAPFIIFPDVDVEQAARTAVTAKFRNNGQVCISASRFYVHPDRREEFTEAVVRFAKTLKLGNGLDDGVEIGPMFEQAAVDKTIGLIEDAQSKGAAVLCGGRRSERFERGFFFEPAVVTGLTRDMRIMRTEPFSPILPILEFTGVDDAIRQANDTPYGLASYVLTNDINTAVNMAERLEFGMVGINDFTPATAQCPFGGMKASGFGREGGIEGIEDYVSAKHVCLGVTA
ncbi:MAG: NAD-dependent succinate-semialdehyde dehydrogenase [Phycisphaerae bacterium]|nr:NAD-dependent succinate-semialdehyde dehydrogenase [Phycisphaerae bacterium]